MGRAVRLPAIPENALVNITDDIVLDYCNGLVDVVRSFSQQLQAITLPPIHNPGHNLRARDWVVIKKHVRKTCLEPRWKGPYQVLTTTTAVKCAGLPNWIHVSHTKRVVSPQVHEKVLWRAPTAAKEVALPEPELEQVEPEVDPKLVEDGSITRVRDEGAGAQEAEQEPNPTEATGEPSTGGFLPEVDGGEAQADQVPDLEGERIETEQSQSDPIPPEPVAGPSRENTTDRGKEKSPILKRLLTEGTRKVDNWTESQMGKKKELVINKPIEEEVDATRKDELSEGELAGERRLKRKRVASRRYAGPEWAYAATSEWQNKFMSFCFDREVTNQYFDATEGRQ
ncbi:hypothetical protein NDU88_006754 [Pleurodeles waltl]|uniref:Murine leukemia virus integrase C-terminal domain-containing protein n=1 Tax=Pleurodeles waltl TaxID=8319 RepID=A0AAV7WYG3_PLEWA|nr:hypothetical protein NDU88_006754 [Pleurodeles waltl]